LGVPKGCNDKELKKGYRKMCLKHHPDKPTGSEEKFKEISKAYDILSDKKKRQAYDNYGDAVINEHGEMPQHHHQQAGGFPTGTSSFFSSFGGSPPPHGAGGPAGGMPGFSSFNFGGLNAENLFGSSTSRTSGMDGGLNIDLSDLLRQMGAGQGPFDTRTQAQQAAGGGNPFGGQSSQYTSSPPAAKAYTRDCYCTLEELATGTTKKMKVKFGKYSKVYTIQLQKGWKAGTKVKFNSSKDGRFGAMTFVIQEKKHPLLERRGDDLVYRHDLKKSLHQVPNNNSDNTKTAAGIVKLELVLPDGEVWTRTLAKSSSFLRQGQTLTITGKGMPIKGGPERGNLIIEFFDSSSSRRSNTASNSAKAKQQQPS